LVLRVVYRLPVPLYIAGNIRPGRHVIPASSIKKRKQHSEFIPSTVAKFPVSPAAVAVPARGRHMYGVESKPRYVGLFRKVH
jgi:hypothetical protein